MSKNLVIFSMSLFHLKMKSNSLYDYDSLSPYECHHSENIHLNNIVEKKRLISGIVMYINDNNEIKKELINAVFLDMNLKEKGMRPKIINKLQKLYE